jgi:6,7-dimethyl-8-ribityllumazine synthase
VKAAPRGRPDARGLRVLVLRSSFNSAVVDGLALGAYAALVEMGALPESIVAMEVPGAFELPLAAQAAGRSGRFDAIVALGAVIRGETDHYEHIAREASAGLAAAARETGVPVGFGVLTVEDEAQAVARAAKGPDNKGAEAARAAVAMAHVVKRLANEKGNHGDTETRRTARKVMQERALSGKPATAARRKVKRGGRSR